MKTLNLKEYNVTELGTLESMTIDGGFNQAAYNDGVYVGNLIKKVIMGITILKYLE